MPTEDQINEWRFRYAFRLAPQTTDRCHDCAHAARIAADRVRCTLLDIYVANAQKIRCGGHEPRDTKEG